MFTDQRGLPLSTTSDEAAQRYREGIALTFAVWPGSADSFDDAIAADPDFALPNAARAWQFAMAGEPGKARTFMARGAELAAVRGDERERSHIQVLSTVLTGRSQEGL